MSALSIHPIEYIKLHLHLGTKIRGTQLFTTIVSRVFDFAEHAAAGALVLLITVLAIVSFMQISSATIITSFYIENIPKVIFTP